MLIISPPNSSYCSQVTTIKGVSYTFTYRLDTRSNPNRWNLDIADIEGNHIITLRIIEGNDLTSHLESLELNWGGFLFVNSIVSDPKPLSSDNFGYGKEYELVFVDYSEL